MIKSVFAHDIGTRWENHSARLYVTIQGILVGLIAMVHGTAEIMLGNSPTGGLLLATVGAFTLIPNYLATGISAFCVGVSLIVWTIGFVDTRRGPAIFLAISILLFLVGGGIAQVAFFVIAWGVATQIHGPLQWWRRTLPMRHRERLAARWGLILAASYVFLGIGVAIWLFVLPPGVVHGISVVQYVCWGSLVVGLGLQLLAIVAGFARDLQGQAREGSEAMATTAQRVKESAPKPATRMVASWFGVVAGVAGLEHGFLEILQGSARPAGLMFASMGAPCETEKAWNACEPALSIVPNYLITGILACALGLIILVWASAFMPRRRSGVMLILLSLTLLLFGGGVFPPLFGVIGGMAGTLMARPLPGEPAGRLLRAAARLWPWPLVVFLLWALGQFPVGYFFNDFLKGIMVFVLPLAVVLLTLSVYSAYAYDASGATPDGRLT
ncbi:MAG TPA: hypothetical protein VGA61_14030 [Anaerolineae bacterium]